jgi:hypothetical protein
MPNLYIEALPKGCPEGSATDDFVVEGHADHVLATFKTKKEGINRARKKNHFHTVRSSGLHPRGKYRDIAAIRARSALVRVRDRSCCLAYLEFRHLSFARSAR